MGYQIRVAPRESRDLQAGPQFCHPTRQLEQVVRAYIRHHDDHRPHRSLEQRPPLAKPPPAERPPPNQIGRRDRLGGLIHEYYAIAA
jgi:hypothetical protein